jgi:hypothetical protein
LSGGDLLDGHIALAHGALWWSLWLWVLEAQTVTPHFQFLLQIQ